MEKSFKTAVFVVMVSVFLTAIVLSNIKHENHNKYKNYIIEHSDDIRVGRDSVNFNIDSCKYNYFTDVTLQIHDDSSYRVIFWGDRDSWLWGIKLDDYFSVDIPYNRYKGKNVEKDIQIIEILNSFNKTTPPTKDSVFVNKYTWLNGISDVLKHNQRWFLY